MKKYNKTRRLAILPSYKSEFDRDFIKRDSCLQLQTAQIVLDPFGTLAKETYKLGVKSEHSKRATYLNFLKNLDKSFDEKILYLDTKIKEKESKKELNWAEEEFLKSLKNSLKATTKFRKFLDNNLPQLNSESELSSISTGALFKITSRVAAFLSDSFYSESFYDRITNELQALNLTQDEPIVKLIEFSKGDSYNPLWGMTSWIQDEFYNDFISNVRFKNNPFLELNKDVLYNGIEVIKRTYGDDATIKTLISLINDHDNFVGGFYSHTFKDSSMIRDYLDSSFNNVEMFDLLCPKPGTKPIDFLDCLTYGEKISISFNTGRGKTVNQFIASMILRRIENAVLCRPGDPTTRSYGNVYLVNENLYYDFQQLQRFKTKTSYLIDTFSIFQPEF